MIKTDLDLSTCTTEELYTLVKHGRVTYDQFEEWLHARDHDQYLNGCGAQSVASMFGE